MKPSEGIAPSSLLSLESLVSDNTFILTWHGGRCGIWTHRTLITFVNFQDWCIKPISANLPYGTGGANRTLIYGFGDRRSTVELHLFTIVCVFKNGADGENRTRNNSVEDCSFTIKLHPHKHPLIQKSRVKLKEVTLLSKRLLRCWIVSFWIPHLPYVDFPTLRVVGRPICSPTYFICIFFRFFHNS